MQDYSVISKGAYARPQTENFVSVTSFLFIRQYGKKYLLLKLKNTRAEAVDEVNLKVTLLDKKGQTLSVLHLSSDKCGPVRSFAFSEKIEVDEACCDFVAKVESAVYGGYLYKDGKGGVAIDYEAAQGGGFDVNTVRAAMRGKTRAVTEKRLGVPVAVSVLACLLLVCAALVTYFQLKNFMDNATGFTYSGVEYVFADADKAPGSEIIVTGYRGTKPNVVIPEKIDGYVVSEIRGGAFEGNGKIKRLKIEGAIKIGGYAFADCAKLESVTMNNAAEVGGNAFDNCRALQTLEITGDSEIVLGEYAFRDCSALEAVKIRQQIIYPENLAVFSGANSVKELYLQNYGAYTISRLFGENTVTPLESLTINYLDGICDSFCLNLSFLESVNIAYIEGEGYDIGNFAFFGTSLKTLKLPLGLTSIGDNSLSGTQITSFNAYGAEIIGEYAFSDCKQLKSFTVPESLTLLSRSAFSGCSSLENVTFEGEDNLKEIGEKAFYRCERIESIEIPDSVEFIGAQLLVGCNSLVSMTLPYLGSSADDCQTMEYLFGNVNTNLKSITLTAATAVAPQAFYGCSDVKEINLNEGLGHIGDYAFYGCVRLNSIVIPSSVSGAGYGIFECCYRLFEVYNLSEVELSCDYAIAVYSSLEQSVPKSEREGYTVAYSYGAFAQPAGWYLIGYPEDEFLTLPESFLRASSFSIIDYLFYNDSDIRRVILSDGVESLGKYAFYGCSSLTDVTVPRPVTKIETCAFAYCGELERATVYGIVTEVGDSAFYCCSSLKEISLNGSFVNVGNDAFGGCYSLTSVSINGVTSIGARAFANDYALESVQISRADGNIGEYAFIGCTSLEEFYVPEGTVQIEANAFYGCDTLRKVTLPKSLTEIGDYAFDGCQRLRAVVNYSALDISDGENCGNVGRFAVFVATRESDAAALVYNDINGVTFLQFYDDWVAVWCDGGVTRLEFSALSGYNSLKIASFAFSENPTIKSADLKGVSVIGDSAFYSCFSLTNVVLDRSLVEIGENAFSYCIGLTDINLQDTKLSSLGACAFFDCMKLTYVSLPRTLGEIPEQTFYYCSALTDAVIPQSVYFIGEQAFFGCTSLLQVHNLSRLIMVAGSSGNGFCAYYALHVFNDADSKMTFAEKDGYKFANYAQNWYLYGYSNYDYYKILPESFTFENSTISSYKIRAGALSSASYIVIPTSVTEIENNSINSALAVYYCGTGTQWTAVRPEDTGFTQVYYYSPCIHTDGDWLWTYQSGGYPVTYQTELVWTVTREATCTKDGVRTGVCPVCGEAKSEVIEKLYHIYGEDGKCTRCGEQGEYLNGLSGSDSYGLSANYFEADKLSFVSTNTGYGTYATLTLTAKEDMQVMFACRTPTYYDLLTITAGGEEVANFSSISDYPFKLELLKGQSLTFRFYKSSYSYNSSSATISYILIFV
ncbi:MAG: leucine-rich repeat domain-containing protein [Clostridia bacterium]|nr:leucine-rich repeat domain-containing protein [Clostridia bacterium]